MNPFSNASRARIGLATIILGVYPLLSSLSALWRNTGEKSAPQFPSSPLGLLLFGCLQLAVFGVFWLVFWGLSRPNRETLWWKWRGGFEPVWLGLLYSLVLRFGVGIVAVFVLTFATLLGAEPEALKGALENEGARKLLAGLSQNREPLYRALTLTFIPFVVAGLREELWRVGVMAGMWALLPQSWSENARIAVTIGVSSVAFGLGHIYQGATGVVATTLLGAGMGYLMFRHRSIWPVVFAHGFLDALTFAVAPYASQIEKLAK